MTDKVGLAGKRTCLARLVKLKCPDNVAMAQRLNLCCQTVEILIQLIMTFDSRKYYGKTPRKHDIDLER